MELFGKNTLSFFETRNCTRDLREAWENHVPRQTRHRSANPVSLLRQYTGSNLFLIYIYLFNVYIHQKKTRNYTQLFIVKSHTNTVELTHPMLPINNRQFNARSGFHEG